MKRIVICGSKRFKTEVLRIGEYLSSKGYEVVVPREFLVAMNKRDQALLHFSEIEKKETDAVLVVNDTKKTENENVQNYIGPNSFAEIAFGFYFGKKVFLKNDIYEPYKDELIGWDVIPLKGNVDLMIEQL